jgi:formylglycine-generating enzyme required for sulfatase activity
VSSKPVAESSFGLADMAGNLSEWLDAATCLPKDRKCVYARGQSWHLACGTSFIEPDLDIAGHLALASCRVEADEGAVTVGVRCAD